MTDEKRHITAEDLYNMKLATDNRISPDGRHVIYSVQRVDKKKEKKYSNLWLVPVEGGEARQFTYGDQSDGQPRWSPDGRQIAFLSNRKDEKQPQIYLIPFDGGEARPLTDLKGNFSQFHWSPDGERLLLMFRKLDQEALEREEDEQKKKLGIVQRHISRVTYRFDAMGYLPQEQWHVWVVEVADGSARQITEGMDYAETEPRWSPDGQTIYFLSNRSEAPDLDPDAVDLYAMPAEGAPEAEWRKIETPYGRKMVPSVSPDGQWIAYLGREGRGNWWQNTSLWVVSTDGSEPARNLTGPFDFEVSSDTLADAGDHPTLPPTWSPDSRRLSFQVSRHGSTTLHALDHDGRNLQEIVGPPGSVGVFNLDDANSRLAYHQACMDDPGQVWVREMASGRARRLTHLNEEWLSEVDLGQMEEVWYKGPDGNNLQGWILKPPGFDPGRQYPSILEIHGGPWLQYGHAFMHEFYFLAAQGYVVYFTNPRGGQGYGESHGKAIHRNWGEADYADIMAWTDLVAAKLYIDTSRMGITGGSYGGFLTAWTIGHTDRFKAAVVQRAVTNAISFWGSSDVGLNFEDPWCSKAPWEDLETYWRQSPMKYVGDVKTPTLVLHSEHDYRVDLEQGVQFFRALRRQGVDTELVLFPEESHGLSRGGRTDRRIARLGHIVRWFDRYLKGEG